MKFTLNHNNINVADLERSIAFYEEALGMKVARRHQAADGAFAMAFISDGNPDHQIELTWLRDKEGPYELGDNESHIAFVADDYDAAHAHHEKMGCICFENNSMGLYFIEDPDGYWLEILPPR